MQGLYTLSPSAQGCLFVLYYHCQPIDRILAITITRRELSLIPSAIRLWIAQIRSNSIRQIDPVTDL